MSADDWVSMPSGVRFCPGQPHVSGVYLADIAHCLANTCHFHGSPRVFFSVAQHSLLVAQNLPHDLRAAGLMHDAHEAYIGDLVRPLVRSLPTGAQAAIGNLKRGLDVIIAERFGLNLSQLWGRTVLNADNRALATEAEQLVNGDGEPWWLESLGEPYSDILHPMPPEVAREAFLAAAQIYGIGEQGAEGEGS